MFALKSSGDPEAYWPNSNFSRGTQSDGGLPRVEAGVAPARCAVAIKWHDPIGPIMLFSLPYCLVRLSRNSSNRSRRSSGSLSGQKRKHPRLVDCVVIGKPNTVQTTGPTIGYLVGQRKMEHNCWLPATI